MGATRARAGQVASALHVLTRIVTEERDQPLSAEAQAQIAQAATMWLTAKQPTERPAEIRTAGGLALALGTPDLVARVRVLSRDAEALRSLGMSEPDLVRWVQEGLRRMLAEREGHQSVFTPGYR
jgi:hypothetical protein